MRNQFTPSIQLLSILLTPSILIDIFLDYSHNKKMHNVRPGTYTSHLDEEVKNYLSERASAKGIGLGEMVNDLLKKDIALIEGVK